MTCPAFAPDGGFVATVLNYVDCQAQAIGGGGYQALATPGSTLALVLTGLLTLFVALFGYRLLLGQGGDLRSAVLSLVKVGIVLALATSWPAFRTLAYDVTMKGPAELASSIGIPAGLPGTDGGMAVRLQGVDDELAELNWRGAGKPPDAEEATGPTQGLTPQQQAEEQARLNDIQNRPRWNPAADAKMLAQARTLYLTGAIAAFASVRIVAGLLLALGPLFVLFLLFDSTRGLFEGWVRGIAGAALGALATTIVLGVQLALLEPWLAFILTQRRFNVATPTVPVEMLVTNLVFVIVVLAALAATARVAKGFRIPDTVRLAPGRWIQAMGSDRAVAAVPAVAAAGAAARAEAADERPRARALADAVVASQRREIAAPAPAPARLGSAQVTEAAGRAAARDAAPMTVAAVPQTFGYRRRTRSRVSAAAGRRDSSR